MGLSLSKEGRVALFVLFLLHWQSRFKGFDIIYPLAKIGNKSETSKLFCEKGTIYLHFRSLFRTFAAQ